MSFVHMYVHMSLHVQMPIYWTFNVGDLILLPANTWRNNNIIITSKRRRGAVLTLSHYYYVVCAPGVGILLITKLDLFSRFSWFLITFRWPDDLINWPNQHNNIKFNESNIDHNINYMNICNVVSASASWYYNVRSQNEFGYNFQTLHRISWYHDISQYFS